MAVRNAASPSETGTNRAWLVAATLVVLFVLALFLRAYWNLDAAHPSEGKFVLSGGSDPYYHKRAIDAILADKDGDGTPDFETLVHDPMLNYPYGSVNPNPPLFQWTVALTGYALQGLFSPETGPDGTLSALEVSTWWAMLWVPAVLGALTVFPIYFIGKALFDRRIGVVAALLWAISTSAIDATGLGLSDHDAALMLFATLAFLFYIKTIQGFRGEGNWVRSWRDGAAVTSGLGALVRARGAAFGYALLTGVSIGALALVWKGFPYVVGIIFAYAVLQMVVDHWRSRDSTGLFLGTTLALLVGTLMAYPYYAQVGVTNFITPVFFIIASLVFIGVVLVPTRDLPTILVMPAAAVVALVAALAAFFVFPNVAQKLLHATVYFKQSTLYQTIAEAHPADFATIAFGIGPVPFFLALAGWFVVLFGLRRNPGRGHLFAVVWAAVALYMAASAVRFLFNAIPIFAVFGAFMIVWLVDWLDFAAIRRAMAANGGFAGVRKGVRPLHVIGAVLAVLLLAFPNVMLAADAAMPRSEEIDLCERMADSPEQATAVCRQGTEEGSFGQRLLLNRFGAYGQNFLSDQWRDSLRWLDEHDANVTNPAERGAFLAWWDYGHWAIAVGRHPAVADNFQNGYEFAANFLLAQNESHAIQLLAMRHLGLFSKQTDPTAAYLEVRGKVVPMLVGAGVPEADATPAFNELVGCPAGADGCPEGRQPFGYATALADPAKATAFLKAVEDATCGLEGGCKRIRYFTTDVRMLPLDDPQTTGLVEQSSIFYAPVTLAGRDGDDYVAYRIQVGGAYLSREQYEQRARNPIATVEVAGERLEYQPTFFNSMYWRGYAGLPVEAAPPILGDQVYRAVVCAQPGYGLEHFRLVYANEEVKILEYYEGAVVEGTIMEEGAPASDVTVTAYDDAGRILDALPTRSPACGPGDVPHASAVTNATGQFRLLAPFAMEGGAVTLVASRDGTELGRTALAITREDARTGKLFPAEIAVRKGSVNATVFLDGNADGQYDAENDTAMADLPVHVGDQRAVTDAEGKAFFAGVPGGRSTVTIESDRYEIARGASVVVAPGDNATEHLVALREKSAELSGRVVTQGANGTEPVVSATIELTPVDTAGGATAQTVTTNATGHFSVGLRAGTYNVTIAGYVLDEGDRQVTLAAGEAVRDRDFVVAREQ